MSQPFKLYRLQQIDSQLDKMKTHLAEIEKELNNDSTLITAKKRNETADQKFQEKRKKRQRAEETLRAQRLKIEHTESNLYSGKINNPKELQDLENESTSLKRYMSVLEDRLIEAMVAEEDAQDSYEALSSALEEEKQKYDHKILTCKSEKEEILVDVKRLNEERDAMIASVPEDDLALYDHLRSQRRGIAVSRVTNKACSACGTTLSAALLHASRNPNQLNHCETCGRILYFG